MKHIVTIWKKELRDTIRDRRTLVSMIILPMVLMPAIIIGMGRLTQFQIEQAQEKTVKIGIVNEAAAPELAAVLKETPKITLASVAENPGESVRKRDVDAVVIIPDDAQTLLATEGNFVIEVIRNSLNDASSTALQRIAIATERYNSLLVSSRLNAAGVDPRLMHGVTVQPVESATQQELGGFGLGFLLPLFIIMWAVTGGQYTAVDVSAGEKERKTLEALLLVPAKRIQIVFGKFLAVATAALISVVIALGSLYAVFIFGGADLFNGMNATSTGSVVQPAQTGFDFSLDPAALGIMFGVSIVLVALFSALNLSVAIFAKSYKEAQSYIGPSYLVIILPVVAFNTIPGFQPTLGYFFIPVVNAVLLFKEILIGTYDLMHLAVTVVSLVIVALAAIMIATRIYQKESVLLKE